MAPTDKTPDLSGATDAPEASVPEDLQHDDVHQFTVVRQTNVPGTAGPSDTAQSRGMSAAAAVDWIKQEVARL